jgi:hypothetical protein
MHADHSQESHHQRAIEFVDIFAIRNVRKVLRQRSRGKRRAEQGEASVPWRTDAPFSAG